MFSRDPVVFAAAATTGYFLSAFQAESSIQSPYSRRLLPLVAGGPPALPGFRLAFPAFIRR